MTVLVRLDCRSRGCQAGTIERSSTGELQIVIRGNAYGDWDNEPVPLRLDEPDAWPFLYHCPECRTALYLENWEVTATLAKAEKAGEPVRLTVYAE